VRHAGGQVGQGKDAERTGEAVDHGHDVVRAPLHPEPAIRRAEVEPGRRNEEARRAEDRIERQPPRQRMAAAHHADRMVQDEPEHADMARQRGEHPDREVERATLDPLLRPGVRVRHEGHPRGLLGASLQNG
jgi:hypothetical protein